MKKFGLTLLVLLILGIIIVIAMVSSGDGYVRPGVTEGMKDKVIGVALADPQVRDFANASYERSQPEYIKPGDTGAYLKDNARYAGVSFHSNAGGEPIYLLVIVDTFTLKEAGVFYIGVPFIMDSWIIIPPENGIAEEMMGGFNLSSPLKYAMPEISSGGSKMNITPVGARLCPVIVNEDNYRKYINGSDYETPELMDPHTGDRVRVDGSGPIASGWSAKYILPPEIQSYQVSAGINTRYYLILENREKDRNVKIIYRHPLGPINE